MLGILFHRYITFYSLMYVVCMRSEKKLFSREYGAFSLSEPHRVRRVYVCMYVYRWMDMRMCSA
jgi:hypothetical protein